MLLSCKVDRSGTNPVGVISFSTVPRRSPDAMRDPGGSSSSPRIRMQRVPIGTAPCYISQRFFINR